MPKRLTILLPIAMFLITGNSYMIHAQVVPAAWKTEKYVKFLHGKKIGIVANAASVVGKVNIVDTLIRCGTDIRVIFSPEHGFRNFIEAGEEAGDYTDPVTRLQVISLYGIKKKPADMDLQGLDLVVFYIQDVGVRFYTYISTLSLLMEACAENHIPLLVLDTPNPNASYIDGPVLDPRYKSFVGMHPVPMVYGMTIGEYARMVNGEGWLGKELQCDLTVFPIDDYTHRTAFVPVEKPSPNLANGNSIILYPSLCLFEGTVISVGRGTPFPFEVYGHPDLKGYDFSFTPRPLPGIDSHPRYKGKLCYGEDLRNYYNEHPSEKGKIILTWLLRAFKKTGKKEFFTDYFDHLAGNATLKEQIIRGMDEDQIRRSWQAGIQEFRKIRQKYLLYP